MSNGAEITSMDARILSAQILSLFSSPVQIVMPQGLKKIIVPVFCILRYNALIFERHIIEGQRDRWYKVKK